MHRAKQFWKLFRTLAFGISFAVAESRSHFPPGNVATMPRELQTITGTSNEPLWWSRISSGFNGVNLARCEQKSDPPVTGSKCPKVPKTCFFGTQDCDGYGAHPTSRCFCDGSAGSRSWKCIEEKCPVFPPPSSGCTADGRANHSSSDPLCPDLGPLSVGGGSPGSCVTRLFDKQCSYGSEKWYVFHLLLSMGNFFDPCIFLLYIWLTIFCNSGGNEQLWAVQCKLHCDV
jgi:hypothetical protein